ncbi:MAG TPA: hypothetical protein QGF35_06270 [Dehalococcoidia bacterium]|jgi:hypothetical protein|nr:hypothetical protein [Dehalococcoidia bacterium]
MSQAIHLGAIVLSAGRMLLARPGNDRPWALPGGILEPHHADTEAGMLEYLSLFSISVNQIENDFIDTYFLPEKAGRGLLNIYAPSDWTGEVHAPGNAQIEWFAPGELVELEMEEHVRSAILEVLGIGQKPERDTEFLEELSLALENERWPATGDDLPGIRPSVRALLEVAIAAAVSGRAGLRERLVAAVARGAKPSELADVLLMVDSHTGNGIAKQGLALISQIDERERQ